MMCSIIDRFSRDFRLKDWWIRLRLARQARLDPIELGRVDRRQMDHRHPDITVIVEQLCAHGFGKALNGMLGTTVSRLQGNSTESQSRSHLNDRPMISR